MQACKTAGRLTGQRPYRFLRSSLSRMPSTSTPGWVAYIRQICSTRAGSAPVLAAMSGTGLPASMSLITSFTSLCMSRSDNDCPGSPADCAEGDEDGAGDDAGGAGDDADGAGDDAGGAGDDADDADDADGAGGDAGDAGDDADGAGGDADGSGRSIRCTAISCVPGYRVRIIMVRGSLNLRRPQLPGLR